MARVDVIKVRVDDLTYDKLRVISKREGIAIGQLVYSWVSSAKTPELFYSPLKSTPIRQIRFTPEQSTTIDELSLTCDISSSIYLYTVIMKKLK